MVLDVQQLIQNILLRSEASHSSKFSSIFLTLRQHYITLSTNTQKSFLLIICTLLLVSWSKTRTIWKRRRRIKERRKEKETVAFWDRKWRTYITHIRQCLRFVWWMKSWMLSLENRWKGWWFEELNVASFFAPHATNKSSCFLLETQNHILHLLT